MATQERKDKLFRIEGKIINRKTQQGIPGLRVQVWDKDKKIDDFLGSSTTDEKGYYLVEFYDSSFKSCYGDELPDVFFKIYLANTLIKNTENTVEWDLSSRETVIIMEVELEDQVKPGLYSVKGKVTDNANNPLPGLQVQAIGRYLRKETLLGSGQTNEGGEYHISYPVSDADKSAVNLALKVLDEEGKVLHRTKVHHHVPKEIEIDIRVQKDFPGFSGFERMVRALQPLLEEGLTFADLEQDEEHDDISFLSGKTGIEVNKIARFVMAHKLGEMGIQSEFWFALLGGSFFQYNENQSLKEQLTAILDSLSSLDAAAVRKSITRSFNRDEIPGTFRDKVNDWVEAFLKFTANRSVKQADKPTFVKSALEHAGIKDANKQEKFARLFNQHKALTRELLETLEKDKSFKKAEIADLHTSYRLSELTRGDFSVVKMIKDEFDIRQPGKIRSLAKKSENQWVSLVKQKHAAGEIKLPLESSELPGKVKMQEADVYGKTLELRFREAFPTSAFTGALERGLDNGGAPGLKHGQALAGFLNAHQNFEFLNTPVDNYFENSIRPDFKHLAENKDFRLEVKAVQRVFKLAPTFEATDTLLADDIHSAQKIYRMGESEFVRTYGTSSGFNAESARLTWNRAADTHAAVLTIVSDFKSLEAGGLPMALKHDSSALSEFPNWQNLFKTGDLCQCEHCRSVLSPAAYFSDLMMFLKDRKAANPARTVKDILLRRRPDLGFLELNCDNALTPLPYIDVVCEVLEDAVDAADANDLEITGLDLIPKDAEAAKAAVAAAFAAALANQVNDGKEKIQLGDDFSLSKVEPSGLARWVVHGDNVTYLLEEKSTADFFAQILCNTKTSAAELRAYPQYVNPKAYEKLREAKHPFTLPFDLFAREVEAAFQKTNIKRWDLMRTLRDNALPNNPNDGDIASEYFGISADPDADFDEKRLILVAETTVASQKVSWGESGNDWLEKVGSVKNFLNKTGLEYNELLALLDLEFINPDSDIAIQHDDQSCDTDKKSIQVLDEYKLDRIHRFLRLWRKLKDWKMWELDLVIRHPAIGNGALEEPFLVHLFYFDHLKNRLGKKASVEHLCALLGDLNIKAHFTKLHKKRDDGLYQGLFLNRRLIQPLDPAFEIDPAIGDLPPGETITAHHTVLQAVLGIRESELDILKGLTKASDGTPYITDDLTLSNLSFVWRHAWLARMLKFKAEEWKILLKIFQQDILHFANPQAVWEFIEDIDQLKKTGFKPDELNWLLAADPSAKAAPKESDAAHFLAALRKELQAIKTEYDPTQYDFLSVIPEKDKLTALLTSLLQKLNRDEAETRFFIATLRDEVNIETNVAALPPDFDFPDAITNAIRIRYDKLRKTFCFTGLMTDTDRTTLLNDPLLATVTGNAAYQEAIEELFTRPRHALKFFEPVFTAPLANLPAAVDFKALPDAALAMKISYDTEQRLLCFTGIMLKEEKADIDSLSADTDYLNAVANLFDHPRTIAPPDERIWLLDADLQFPLRDLDTPGNDYLAENLVTATTKALVYLLKTLSENTVVQQCSAQLGLTEALTRLLLTHYPVLPGTLMTHLTGTFASTTGVVDYVTLKTTFDGWYWASRAAAIWTKWKITLAELEKIITLTSGAQLLNFETLPLDDTGAIPPIDRFLRTSRLVRLRDRLPETKISLLEVLETLSKGTYTTAADFAADVEGLNEAWLAADVKEMIASLDLSYPDDYLLPETWERLRRAFYFLDNLNTGADRAKTFAAAAMTDVHAKTIKELLRSKFGTETWLTLSAEIQDVMRERKRDALAAYLLTRSKPADAPSGKWENTNDLYAYYLLHVEMSSCQLTSRLVQGSGSVQLFVQRCFMGLEPDVKVNTDGDDGDSAWRWWKWMRKYRVWEANRKVFFYPENWIEPELKKDRSPFFKDLENELLQNEINQHNVETAFLNYLEKLDGVAQLEIAGFYQEDDGDNAIIHVFGRTIGAEPHLYYYRRYDYRQWTAWEKVELDIQGDYLIPAVINKRLFLFWPIFMEVPDEEGNSKVTIPPASMEEQKNKDLPKTYKRLKIQMAVSEYWQGKWRPKKISKDFNESHPYEFEIVKKHYRFIPIDRSETDGRFGIMYDGYSLANDGTNCVYLKGAFEISGCKGVPKKTSFQGIFDPVIRPESSATGEYTAFMKWEELDKQNVPDPDFLPTTEDVPPFLLNDFTLENAFSGLEGLRFIPVLWSTPGIYKMTPPWQLSYLDKFSLDWAVMLSILIEPPTVPIGSWLPFFYNDKKRTFFVLPSLLSGFFAPSPPVQEQEEGEDSSTSGGVRNYYPEVKKFFWQWENYFEGLLRNWVNGFDPAALPDAERQQLEVFLHRQFPEDTPPPKETEPSYSDEQVRNLIVRFCMRFVHLLLKQWSLFLFQFRQFHFKNFYHPFVCDFAKLVNNPLKGIPAMMSRETQLKNTGFSFNQTYQPVPYCVVKQPTDPNEVDAYPKEVVDFSPDGAYSCYNWELFFHAPLLIANWLSKNQRFEEAQEWYHFIFNPIGVESAVEDGPAMSKYWITKPFYETTDPQYDRQRIDNILRMLASDTNVSAQAKKDLEGQVLDWRTNPFEPHRLANYRTVAYQKTVVMKYLDNLIAWGDYLFRQDSMESINEATQLYILAAEILGPQPKKIPSHAKPTVESFNELEHLFEEGKNRFGNPLVEVENIVHGMQGASADGANQAPLPMLYFCIPQNDKMLGYWDTVADRLYKIRHCMNIEGVVRQLALFEPPIDPGALVNAVASGMDINSALADLNAPLPLYRFNVLLQKANEVCSDVKALGGALLSALEKKDAEALGLLRQSQEIRTLEAVKTVREKQIEEAKESLESFRRSKLTIEVRRNFYRDIEEESVREKASEVMHEIGIASEAISTILNTAAGNAHLVPKTKIGVSGFGGTPSVTVEYGGENVGNSTSSWGTFFSGLGRVAHSSANLMATEASYKRRWENWKLQERLADKELEQMDKQIAAAELRIAIAEKELKNHVIQIENAKATDDFMRSKYTNEELYQWQVGQISDVYFRSYKLAYDLAKRVERCFRFELGLQDSSYINFGYWDSLKKGLLSGEKLQYDLRRLETAYLEQNRREFEITKHISLALLDPLALVKLRETGRCFLSLSEEIFDLDFPGHYFRRIKSVSLTLPCIVGPYTTVSCTLRLLKNSIRINTANGDNGYPHNIDDQGLPSSDDRFIENNIPVKAIAASNAQNDSGVFELSFRDERYLPFEGAGAVSEWSLELFSDLPANNPDPENPDFGKPLRQFDYSTISDAILHVKYMAREDAGVFKNGAVTHLRDYFSEGGATHCLRMFNLRQEFPNQWHSFLHPANPDDGNIFQLEMSPALFPVLHQGKTLKINTIWLLARCTDQGSYDVDMTTLYDSFTMALAPVNQYGGLHFSQNDVAAGEIKVVPTDTPVKWQLEMTIPVGVEVEDLLLVLGYVWE